MIKYILIAFVFLSCQTKSGQQKAQVSNEILDTISTAPSKLDAQPALFETAFVKGTSINGRGGEIECFGITIGKLKVPSGRIIACDPLHIDEYGIPFNQLFPTGEFPVQLSIANVDNAGSIAFARIKFSDEPVARWELALIKDQQPLPVGGDKIHGFGVDAGVGIFMDKEAVKGLDTKKIWEMESESPLFKEMDKHRHDNWRYTMYNFGEFNLAAFTTGFGDGRYATYIGFDANGKPCRLTADFGLFNWNE